MLILTTFDPSQVTSLEDKARVDSINILRLALTYNDMSPEMLAKRIAINVKELARTEGMEQSIAYVKNVKAATEANKLMMRAYFGVEL